jgi:hypothetical protein
MTLNGDILTIPKDLYKWLNINIDPKLKDYIQIDKVTGNYKVPANVPVNFVEAEMIQSGMANLIIGDIVPQVGDIVLGTTPITSGTKNPDTFPEM